MKSLRVLFDSKAFERQAVGGVSRYYSELAVALGVAGCSPVVLAPLHVNEHLDSMPGIRCIGKKVRRLPNATPALGAINKIGSFVLASFLKPDVVHETYYSQVASAPGRVPRVTTVYDMIHELYPESFHRLDRTTRRKRATVHRADAIICISESTRKDLIEHLAVDPAKTHVVYLANSLRAPEKARPLQRPYLLFVGGRGGYKNFVTLLDAFAADSDLRRDFSLVCFGGGKASAAEELMLKEKGLDSAQVIFTGGSDDALAAYYQHAELYVCPSLYEGFGIPLLEAMANRCPLAVAKGGSLPEVASDAAEYFDALDPGSIAAAVKRVVYSRQKRAELIVTGEQREKAFSWERCAAETLDIYRSLSA